MTSATHLVLLKLTKEYFTIREARKNFGRNSNLLERKNEAFLLPSDRYDGSKDVN
jgi:hypothetical protein